MKNPGRNSLCILQPPPIPSPLFLCFLLHLITVPAAALDIALNCGITGTSITGKRPWIGDHDSTDYFPIEHQPHSKIRTITSLASHLSIPYSTARLSRSRFIYTVSVSPGPLFIRLHFHSTDYRDFSRRDARFDVKCDNYTLLRNFSAALLADYAGSPTFSREFSIYSQYSHLLSITFTPSTDYYPDAYAFISGIEVVSMPVDLYYQTTESGYRTIKFIGHEAYPYLFGHMDALEMMHRINIGGCLISPESDTGFHRSWTGDADYLTEDLGSVIPVNPSIHFVFDRVPNYTAPENVYKTARSMGISRNINYSYNLTWSFPVDSNFYYLIRLHFCEIVQEINHRFDRVFRVFIDSKRAERYFDVIFWAGKRKGVPIYRDYIVDVFNRTNKKLNLTIALHPENEGATRYADAFLNGVEIFKVSDYDGNLAGPNPEGVQVPIPPPVGQSKKSGSVGRKTIVAVVAGSVFSISGLFLFCFLIHRRVKLIKGFPMDKAPDERPKGHHSALLPFDRCHHFSLDEIKAATNNFDEDLIIGTGGFGNVYRGTMDGSFVAIKRCTHGSQQGACEFMTEIEMLSQLRHRHLVSLIGCCSDGGEMILVYQYMSRGTLRHHLYNTENPPIPWKKRLEICIGAARGLQYLHAGAKQLIIHRDIKTTNILLDEKWVAKVSDFGISKTGPADIAKSHISTVVKGTFGYLDPEYFRFHRLTEKSDVCSFGVVLLEVLCARPAVDSSLETDQIGLAIWAQSCHLNGTLDEIIDPKLKAEIDPECLRKFGETAVSCLHDRRDHRPTMNDVVRSLELVLQMHAGRTEETTTIRPMYIIGSGGDEESTGLLEEESDDTF